MIPYHYPVVVRQMSDSPDYPSFYVFEQAVTDKVLGGGMLLVAGVVFTYYTIWALFLPFLPSDSPLTAFFPAREWAIRLPLFLLVAGLAAVSLFFAKVTLAEARKKRARGKVA